VGLSETEVLGKVPLFAGLPDEEIERLGALLRPRRYARGAVIFLEGDQGTSLCLIAEGRIRIQLTGTRTGVRSCSTSTGRARFSASWRCWTASRARPTPSRRSPRVCSGSSAPISRRSWTATRARR
jgi:hypothetical protein